MGLRSPRVFGCLPVTSWILGAITFGGAHVDWHFLSKEVNNVIKQVASVCTVTCTACNAAQEELSCSLAFHIKAACTSLVPFQVTRSKGTVTALVTHWSIDRLISIKQCKTPVPYCSGCGEGGRTHRAKFFFSSFFCYPYNIIDSDLNRFQIFYRKLPVVSLLI